MEPGSSNDEVESLVRETSINNNGDRHFSQSNGVRFRTVSADTYYWEFMVRQFKYVCISGLFFWAVYLFSKIV